MHPQPGEHAAIGALDPDVLRMATTRHGYLERSDGYPGCWGYAGFQRVSVLQVREINDFRKKD
ncbi:hypothetical protein D3C78_1902010 [compost metagenome]